MDLHSRFLPCKAGQQHVFALSQEVNLNHLRGLSSHRLDAGSTVLRGGIGAGFGGIKGMPPRSGASTISQFTLGKTFSIASNN
jgi:hypothetical protein